MSEITGPEPENKKPGVTRRDFLKYMGVGAATLATGGSLVGCEEKESQPDVIEKMRTAPIEKMEVVTAAESLEEGNKGKATTLDELRAEAGWSREDTEQFIEVMREKNNYGVAENGIIQPGFYNVPINRSE